MARMRSGPEPTREESLDSVLQDCAVCGRHMWADYENRRTIATLREVVRLRLTIRRCPNAQCTRYHQVYRPECEGQWALPEHEFGLDILARVGTERYQRHQSVSCDKARRELGYAPRPFEQTMADAFAFQAFTMCSKAAPGCAPSPVRCI